MKPEELLSKLLSRGDILTIEQGKLIIKSASGKPVSPEWLAIHSHSLVENIIKISCSLAFQYIGFSTGCYGGNKASGVTLQFQSLKDLESAYAIFNAELTRKRNTAHGKVGSPLPKGQFRVGVRSHFHKFWLQTGLTTPKRLSAFHDYMGNLKSLIYTGEFTQSERLNAGTLKPLNIGYKEILNAASRAIMPDNSQTSFGQLPDTIQTRSPDKKIPQPHMYQGIQANETTSTKNHGNTLSGSAGMRGNVISLNPQPKNPEDQTVEEWLTDYSGERE